MTPVELASVFPGEGDVAGALRGLDWTATPLGSPEGWPRSLLSAVRIMLTSQFSMWMAWGEDLTFFCNDAYRRDTLGAKYPWALGRSAREVWAEIWDDIGPRIDSVFTDGVATWDETLMLFLERSGYREETYHTFSYSPLVDDDNAIAGMLCVVVEETERVLSERRLATLRDLSAALARAESEDDVYATLDAVFRRHDRDLTFVLACDVAGAHPAVTTVRSTPSGLSRDGVAALTRVLDDGGGERRLALDAIAPDSGVPTGAWGTVAEYAVVLPLRAATGGRRTNTSADAHLVAGLNPFRPPEETMTAFGRLVALQVAASLGTVHALEAERRRAEELEELDRAKTQFFANVSHEFRTPLTLILGPLSALQAEAEERADPDATRELAVIRRNGVRLSKLVNSLLDVSRLDAGRTQASYQRVDLGALTSELAHAFSTVVAQAGLELVVDCDRSEGEVYVDPTMWERIVLNLVSNAVKYTHNGSITVRLETIGDDAVLSVEDTGIGIAPDDLGRIFDRFHRIENARARSAEGTGIGLALVAELVALHGGAVTATSAVEVGSTFVVRLPRGRTHLPADHVSDEAASPGLTELEPFVTETLGWLDGGAPVGGTPDDDEDGERPVDSGDSRTAEVLVVDDNADMRSYVTRVLDRRFRTRAAGNGAEALAAIAERRPDLVVSDIMMPEVDGYELVRRLRADERHADLPVMLLTAQAGSRSELRGVNVGADDYLVKPFSADELLARVDARLAATKDRRLRQSLSGLAERLLRSRDSEAVLAATQELLTDWFGVAHTTLAVVETDGRSVLLRHEPPLPYGVQQRFYRVGIEADIAVCTSIRENAPVVLEDLAEWSVRFPHADQDLRAIGAQSVIVVPLPGAAGEPDGSIASIWSHPRTITDEEVAWYLRVATTVSDALQRLRLSEREHQMLREFQERLLTIDHRSPVAAVAVRYQPANSELLVGGDWYDVSTRSDGALGLSIGDVVGKGLRAATVMAQLRSALGAAASAELDPAGVVDIVDRYAEHLPDALCATLAYLVLAPDGTLSWSVAGHPRPLVAVGEEIRFLDGGRRPPLAARPGLMGSPSATLQLPEASLLLLYTDGLIERRGEELTAGADRLAAAVRASSHLPLAELTDALVERMRPPDGYRDDVAILAARTPGTRGPLFVDVHPAAPTDLREARNRLRAWLHDSGLGRELCDDVMLAVGEASANACEHGSESDPRACVTVELSIHRGELRAAVSDHGTWGDDTAVSSQDGRGRGFAIMDRMMDAVDVRRSPLGTTVLLRRTLPTR